MKKWILFLLMVRTTLLHVAAQLIPEEIALLQKLDSIKKCQSVAKHF